MFSQPADVAGFISRGALAIIADGMGGEKGGAVASNIAVTVISKAFSSSTASRGEALRKAVEQANSEIYAQRSQSTELGAMGTTCVALALQPPLAWAAWVGDSRLYLIRRGQILQMTEDHSVVQELVSKGEMTREEARNHEDRSVITRVLGGRAKVEVAMWNQPLTVQIGDRMLLCSDGLHDPLEDSAILECATAGPVSEASAALIAEANRCGGYDNISVVLIEIAPAADPGQKPARPTREFIPEGAIRP